MPRVKENPQLFSTTAASTTSTHAHTQRLHVKSFENGKTNAPTDSFSFVLTFFFFPLFLLLFYLFKKCALFSPEHLVSPRLVFISSHRHNNIENSNDIISPRRRRRRRTRFLSTCKTSRFSGLISHFTRVGVIFLVRRDRPRRTDRGPFMSLSTPLVNEEEVRMSDEWYQSTRRLALSLLSSV